MIAHINFFFFTTSPSCAKPNLISLQDQKSKSSETVLPHATPQSPRHQFLPAARTCSRRSTRNGAGAAPLGFALRAQATRPLRGGRISRATEGDLKVVVAVFEIFVDRLADKRFRRAEKAIHLAFVVGEEIGNGLVAARVPASTFSNQQLENVFVSVMPLTFSSRQLENV